MGRTFGLWTKVSLLAVAVFSAAAPVMPPLAGQGGAAAAGAPPAAVVPFDTSEWKTDFSRHSVPFSEIMSGGPPKDGIPAIDKPEFIAVSAASAWLTPTEPVVLVEHGGQARAYPLEILIWHEIVNDTIAGMPVAITFCPLCNTAIAFDRRAAGRVLDFGTTGKLRFSDLVMYDRQTESWWQQALGEGIVGTLTGTRLVPLPAWIVSWTRFATSFPAGTVLSRRTGFQRAYGQNPYAGYDDVNASPFLYRGPADRRLRPMERVVTVSLGGEDVAYPFRILESARVINDRVGGRPIVVFYEKGVTSALDRSSIAGSRDVGTGTTYDRTVDGRVLTFTAAGNRVTDRETGSTWNLLGVATAGSLRGIRLKPVVSGQHFWFAWAAFRPHTRIYQPR